MALPLSNPATTESQGIHSLTCKRDVSIAIPCLASLTRAVRTPLVLHDDGSLEERDLDQLRNGLPGVRIVRRQETEPVVLEKLARYPACRRYRSTHPLSNKLLDIPLSLPADGCLWFCDSDVLFFRRLSHLFPPGDGPVFCEEDNDGYSAAPWKLRLKFGFRIMSGLNSGLFRFPLARLDLDFLEWFLGHPELLSIPGMGEQTAWALLLRDAWPKVFVADQVFCSTRRPVNVDARLVAIHFLYHLKSRVADYAPRAFASLDAMPIATPEFRKPRALSLWRVVQRRVLRRWRSRLN